MNKVRNFAALQDVVSNVKARQMLKSGTMEVGAQQESDCGIMRSGTMRKGELVFLLFTRDVSNVCLPVKRPYRKRKGRKNKAGTLYFTS